MKAAKLFSWLFGVLGGVVLLLGIVFSVWFQGRTGSQQVPRGAVEAARQWMEALSQGDLAGASALMYGEISLAPEDGAQGELESLFWQSYVDSLSCTAGELCQATGTGAAQQVVITALDVPKTWALIQGRAASASDLPQAAREVLSGSCPTVSREVQLSLTFRDGQWWVVGEKALEQALACGLG